MNERPTSSFLGSNPTARSVAIQVLLGCRPGQAFVQELLDDALTRANLEANDRRLTTQLVYGVLRRRGTLDALLRPLITRQPHQVEPLIREILRLGAFQLALLTHIPPHAALHETVELAAQFDNARSKGFINGVLRALQRLLTEDAATGPAADSLPLEAGRYRRLAQPVLPDPTADPVQYVAAGFSLPPWMAERWLKLHGAEETRRLGFWFAGQPATWLRVNRLRTDRAAFLLALQAAGVAAEAGPVPDSVRLLESAGIRTLPGYAEGWFTVQNLSAQNACIALNPTPGSSVLDLCAAPGGKTTHLAELMNNQGQLTACDVDDQRLRTVEQLCQRLGIGIVATHMLGKPPVDPPAGPFDFVLADVPCSNTGVLGRRPEARWRLKPEDFRQMVPLQTRLLRQAAERVKPGGAVVYSTCSIEWQENRQIVDNVLRTMPTLTLEADETQAPGQPADGGYWARLRKRN